MAFFEDPDGNTLALMQEAPKGCIFPKAPGRSNCFLKRCIVRGPRSPPA